MNERKYYNLLCFCGCNNKIEMKSSHKYDGIPRFIKGHQSRIRKTREKIRKTLTGRKHTKERIENMRKSRVGKKNPKNSEFMKKKWQDPKYRENQKRKRIGKKQSKETIEKRRKSNIGKKRSKETIERMRKAATGRINSKEMIEKIRKTLAGRKNPKHSKIMFKKWQDTVYKEKQIKAIIKGSGVKPNKSENKLDRILRDLLPNKYLLNVKGDVIIDGKCPDFVSTNSQKKIIELFGNFWHSEKIVKQPKEKHENQRINHFAKYGYKTLIIWENELEDLEELREKILSFHNK